jgi:hypothetical protein
MYERNHLEEVRIDGRKILKQIKNKWNRRLKTGAISSRIGT